MVIKVTIFWVLGLLTVVPYSIYYLLFQAQRDEYAFLITFPLFWIFGFWGVAGPILGAIKMRRLMRALELAHSPEQMREILHGQEAEEVAIDLIASENKLPRFLARKIYLFGLKKLRQSDQPAGMPDPTGSHHQNPT